MASLSELLEEVQASLDLILRWAVLRICDGNMQVRLAGLGGGCRQRCVWRRCIAPDGAASASNATASVQCPPARLLCNTPTVSPVSLSPASAVPGQGSGDVQGAAGGAGWGGLPDDGL